MKNLLESRAFMYATLGAVFPTIGFALGFYTLVPALILILAFGTLAYSVTPRSKIVFYAPTSESFEEYRGFLNRLITKCEPYVPAQALKELQIIKEQCFELFKFIESKNSYIASEEVANLKNLISTHLLECVNSYLSLPRLYANNHRVNASQTHRDIFIEQLGLFRSVVEQMTSSIVQQQLPQIMSQTQYLQNKLASYHHKN